MNTGRKQPNYVWIVLEKEKLMSLGEVQDMDKLIEVKRNGLPPTDKTKEININKSNDIIIDNITEFLFKRMIDLIFIFVYIIPLLSLFLFIFDVNYFYFYLIIGIFGWLFPSLYITTKIINLLNR